MAEQSKDGNHAGLEAALVAEDIPKRLLLVQWALADSTDLLVDLVCVVGSVVDSMVDVAEEASVVDSKTEAAMGVEVAVTVDVEVLVIKVDHFHQEVATGETEAEAAMVHHLMPLLVLVVQDLVDNLPVGMEAVVDMGDPVPQTVMVQRQ